MRNAALRALRGRPVRIEPFEEGTQVLHVGPYAEELPIAEMLRQFIGEEGRVARGRHHEI